MPEMTEPRPANKTKFPGLGNQAFGFRLQDSGYWFLDPGVGSPQVKNDNQLWSSSKEFVQPGSSFD